ncbi:MAG TPA: four helix bundle protein [Pyrinomonadaceae bacterium]
MNSLALKTFEDVAVWQKAHGFVLAVYLYSDYFPEKEVYGLALQLRRAAVSIAASIAAEFKQEGAVERAQTLLDRAANSVERCRYYLILARDLGYGDSPGLLPQLEEVSRMLGKYRAERLAGRP